MWILHLRRVKNQNQLSGDYFRLDNLNTFFLSILAAVSVNMSVSRWFLTLACSRCFVWRKVCTRTRAWFWIEFFWNLRTRRLHHPSFRLSFFLLQESIPLRVWAIGEVNTMPVVTFDFLKIWREPSVRTFKQQEHDDFFFKFPCKAFLCGVHGKCQIQILTKDLLLNNSEIVKRSPEKCLKKKLNLHETTTHTFVLTCAFCNQIKQNVI